MFMLFNFLIFVSSLGVLAIGIYLTVVTNEANAFNVSFLITGGVLALLSGIAFFMRRSVHLLGFYLVIMFFLFLFQLIVTIVMIIKKERVVELAQKYFSDSGKSYQEIEKQIGDSVLAVSYAMIAFTAIVVSAIPILNAETLKSVMITKKFKLWGSGLYKY